ncbi:MAG: R3H domain-containing nucleic acid-binding protein, partial [Prochlorothrix sp.]
TVDQLLRHRPTSPQVRSVNEEGQVVITQQIPEIPLEVSPSRRGDRGWRSTGQMQPLPLAWNDRKGLKNGKAKPPDPQNIEDNAVPFSVSLISGTEPRHSEAEFQSLLDETLDNLTGHPSAWTTDSLWTEERIHGFGENGEDLPLHVYPYAVSRHHLEQVIQTLQLPVVLTKEIDQADAVLALRSHLKNHSKLRHLAQNHQVPIHAIKSNTLPQIVRGLKRLLNREEAGLPEDSESLFSRSHSNHEELEALEEARLAVEQLVLPKGQPVELLPRPSHIRKMQHELVEHYRLKSASFGEEPNRRLRIYPA